MAWQLREPLFRMAIHSLVDQLGGRCVLAGNVGVQIRLAAALGLDKLGPPAHAIEVVALEGIQAPRRIEDIPVEMVDALGFEASVRAACSTVEIGEERFPVASPEHILGMRLASPDLPADAKWACFVLMRTCAGSLDLEEVRGFLKRCGSVDRQALLAELAYLAV